MTARQYLVPGWGYVEETQSDQYLLPGMGYLNDTTPSVVSASFSAAGRAAASFIGAHLGASSFSSSGVSAALFVGSSQGKAGFAAAGITSASFVGGTKSQIAGYFVPSMGYYDETFPRQFLVPGWGYLDATQITGNEFEVIGSSTASFAGASAITALFSASGQSSASFIGAYKLSSTFSVVGHSFATAYSLSQQLGVFSAQGKSSPAFAGTSAFYTTVSYVNLDDLFNFFSFVPFNPPKAIATVIGHSSAAFVGTGIERSVFACAGRATASFASATGSYSPELDFSNSQNSMYVGVV